MKQIDFSKVGQTGQKEDTDLARPRIRPLNIAGAHKLRCKGITIYP